MAGYPPDSLVTVRPFARHRDGETATIGDHDREVYLTIPASGLDILDDLAAGKTVGETVRSYESKYAETPDIDDFLAALNAEGFVGQTREIPKRRRGLELKWISRRMARMVFNLPMLGVALLAVAGAVWMVADDPGLMPGPTIMLFPHHFALLTWMTLGWTLVGVFLHEVAHLVAARAAGVPARIQISHRMYAAVGETDMTGIWVAPKRWRFVGFISGPLFDMFCVSVIIGILYASRHGVLYLSDIARLWLSALVLTYVARTLWQCFLFLRTDFYYVIAHALRCKSLLADTETMLRNKVAWLFRRPRVDQSGIPRRERWIMRVYSVGWVGGRTLALAVLIFFSGPILIGYFTEVVHLVTGQPTRFNTYDFATVAALVILLDFTGLFLWIRGLAKSAFRRKTGSMIET